MSVPLIGGRPVGAVLLVAGPPGPGASVRRLGALPVVPAEPARRAHGPRALVVRGPLADAAPGRPVAAATPVGSVLTGLPIGVPPAERAGPVVRTPRVPLGEGAPQVATAPPIGEGPERVAEGARRLSEVGVSAPGAPATTGQLGAAAGPRLDRSAAVSAARAIARAAPGRGATRMAPPTAVPGPVRDATAGLRGALVADVPTAPGRGVPAATRQHAGAVRDRPAPGGVAPRMACASRRVGVRRRPLRGGALRIPVLGPGTGRHRVGGGSWPARRRPSREDADR